MTAPESPSGAVASVLVTGFEPFGGMAHNPSWDVAAAVAERAEAGVLVAQQAEAGTTIGGNRAGGSRGRKVQVQALRLPVVYGRAGQALAEALDAAAEQGRAPDVVVSLGLAAGTPGVRLERVGVNLRDARIPDNDGAQPCDVPVVPDAEGALFSTLRLKAAHQRIQDAGIPVQLSLSAGSFVCNDLLYSLLHDVRSRGLAARAGFIHIPDVQSPDSPLSLEQAVQAVDLVIAESLQAGSDAERPGGALH